MKELVVKLLASYSISAYDWSYFGYGKNGDTSENELYITDQLDSVLLAALVDKVEYIVPRYIGGQAFLAIGFEN